MIGMFRQMSFVIPLVLAFAVPYALFSESTAPVRRTLTGWFATGDQQNADSRSVLDRLDSGDSWPLFAEPASPSSKVPQPLDLVTALRFDITPRWVLDRWPRVTTTRSEQQFDGLRVPLITGTTPSDLAGSMTYYFDRESQLQRIAFHGFTGDYRQVVSIVTRDFGMRPKPSVDASIYLNSWNGKPTSALVIRRMAVVQAEAPRRKFEVQLEVNRPNHYFGLSSHFESLLATSTASRATASHTR